MQGRRPTRRVQLRTGIASPVGESVVGVRRRYHRVASLTVLHRGVERLEEVKEGDVLELDGSWRVTQVHPHDHQSCGDHEGVEAAVTLERA